MERGYNKIKEMEKQSSVDREPWRDERERAEFRVFGEKIEIGWHHEREKRARRE